MIFTTVLKELAEICLNALCELKKKTLVWECSTYYFPIRTPEGDFGIRLAAAIMYDKHVWWHVATILIEDVSVKERSLLDEIVFKFNLQYY